MENRKFEVNEKAKPYNIRHRAFYFSRDIIRLVKSISIERVYSSLYDQLVRSATSIGANLVEGYAGSSKKDWKRYYLIALKSANETKYWLCLIRDTMNVDRKKIDTLLEEAEEISKILGAIIVKAG